MHKFLNSNSVIIFSPLFYLFFNDKNIDIIYIYS
nr:MAG TPA: hypothetical protein [Caudoviricetes sp.]